MLFRSREMKANEPKLRVLRCLIDGAEELFGDEPFLASDLYNRVMSLMNWQILWLKWALPIPRNLACT